MRGQYFKAARQFPVAKAELFPSGTHALKINDGRSVYTGQGTDPLEPRDGSVDEPQLVPLGHHETATYRSCWGAQKDASRDENNLILYLHHNEEAARQPLEYCNVVWTSEREV